MHTNIELQPEMILRFKCMSWQHTKSDIFKLADHWNSIVSVVQVHRTRQPCCQKLPFDLHKLDQCPHQTRE